MILERRFFLSGLGTLALVPIGFAQTISPVQKLIAAARAQIGVTRSYDGSYQRLDFPNGDVARTKGVCTDVIIRAYRDAFAFDLQHAVHADMASQFSAYPDLWNLKQPDRNIDHRRVPNLETWLTRYGTVLNLETPPTDWQAGELITMRLPGNLPHIALTSDLYDHASRPLIIHNIGGGTHEEPFDIYDQVRLSGRFKFLPDHLP